MKINANVEAVLNQQINAELWSAYLYLQMSAWAQEQGLKGCGNWMRIQFQEETAHALKLYDYILSRSGTVTLEPIAKVDQSWKSILHMFDETYKHECVVTDKIHNCYEVALAERDHATVNVLQWFIDEQAEEEASVLDIIDQIKLLGETGPGIYHLDKELGTRVFVDPTLAAAP